MRCEEEEEEGEGRGGETVRQCQAETFDRKGGRIEREWMGGWVGGDGCGEVETRYANRRSRD